MRLRLLIALPLLLPASLWAEPQSAVELLNRMAQAGRTLNYEGTFIYEHAGKLQTMQLYHGTDGKNEQDRLVTLDGAAREVVRKGGKVTCILPNHKPLVVEEAGPTPPLPINIPTNVDQLDSFYAVQVAGSERIAGQRARKLVIAPRDGFRYGQQLWLDEKHGLLLKAQLRDEKGKVVEQLVFTRLAVHDGPLPAELLEPKMPGKDLALDSPEEKKPLPPPTPVESGWVVTDLPAGFREEMRRNHTLPGGSAPVEHRVYSDGFASVSVFIESSKSSHPEAPRNVRKGALNAYTRYVDDYRVTVLGEVPEATVRLMGDGVAAREEKAP